LTPGLSRFLLIKDLNLAVWEREIKRDLLAGGIPKRVEALPKPLQQQK